ncbi:hypothetical protein [Bradyrhizobium sp. RDI18]|uniref:hypothetical protein n=1 Tax=Bradyrhizobium sp. RDI18 TaxID=3367400 RepID=UPI00372054CD
MDAGDASIPDNRRTTPSGYDDLIALAHDVNRPMEDVHALAGTADPWMASRPSRLETARWFVDLYQSLGFKVGAHLRRIHYALVSQAEPVIMVDGTPYENTDRCWSTLVRGARDARYLDMLPALSFLDHRSPDALIVREDEEDDYETRIWVGGGAVTSRGGLYSYEGPSFSMPSLEFSPPNIGQPYHLEIWAEKTTLDDVLFPLGRQYDCNVITGAGEMSLTAVEHLVVRARRGKRPVRILYLSDFDPAGQSMPVAVARKIEYLIQQDDLDIQLEPIALTHQQCVEFRLPRTPLKATERRGAKFEARYGEGATELDALEALHPGVIRRILVENIERFYDSDLDSEMAATRNEIRQEIERVEAEVRGRHADEIAAIEEERRALEEEVEERLDELRELIDAREDQLIERMEALSKAMEDELRDLNEPDPDAFEWPSPAEGVEFEDPLFDSRRDYLDQIDRYARFKGKVIRERHKRAPKIRLRRQQNRPW